MASCMKCGKSKLPKRKSDGLRWCSHCGAVPGIGGADRSGIETKVQHETH